MHASFHLHKVLYLFIIPSLKCLGVFLVSFDSPKGPLARIQASVPITFDAIGLISIATLPQQPI